VHQSRHRREELVVTDCDRRSAGRAKRIEDEEITDAPSERAIRMQQ
jgi:hypothetical protein